MDAEHGISLPWFSGLLDSEAHTQLVMVDFHGGVGEGTKDGDDGDFPDGHLTNRLQVLVPLLDIHLVLLARGRDQLQGQKRRRSKLSTRCLLPSARWNSNHDSAA